MSGFKTDIKVGDIVKIYHKNRYNEDLSESIGLVIAVHPWLSQDLRIKSHQTTWWANSQNATKMSDSEAFEYMLLESEK